MSAGNCRAVLEAAPLYERASRLDAAFPNCACETWALTNSNGSGISDEQLVARILTSPDSYNESTSTILTGKLTQVYSIGMSVIRQGASDEEIRKTIEDLTTGGSEQKRLIGAVVASAAMFRSYVTEETGFKWFGLYATDDRGKLNHGDVLGTTTTSKQQQKRRYRLATDMQNHVLVSTECEELICKLREAGM